MNSSPKHRKNATILGYPKVVTNSSRQNDGFASPVYAKCIYLGSRFGSIIKDFTCPVFHGVLSIKHLHAFFISINIYFRYLLYVEASRMTAGACKEMTTSYSLTALPSYDVL